MICPYCERGQCALARHDHEPDCECPRCFPSYPPTEPTEEQLDAEARFLAGEYDDAYRMNRLYEVAGGSY